MPILVGLDGKDKMSKSLNNYIGVTEGPKSMFGKIMSISDEVMWEYIRLLSNFDSKGLKEKHPKEVKLNLSESIVSFYHSKEKALKERKEFEGVFSRGQLPKEILTIKVKESVVDIIEILHNAKMVASKNEARRLLSQGSISLLDSEAKVIAVLKEQSLKISSQGAIFKVGKKRFLKLILQ